MGRRGACRHRPVERSQQPNHLPRWTQSLPGLRQLPSADPPRAPHDSVQRPDQGCTAVNWSIRDAMQQLDGGSTVNPPEKRYSATLRAQIDRDPGTRIEPLLSRGVYAPKGTIRIHRRSTAAIEALRIWNAFPTPSEEGKRCHRRWQQFIPTVRFVFPSAVVSSLNPRLSST